MPKQGLVLVVEDSPTQAQKLSTIIRILGGLNVVVAANGFQAIREIQTSLPDVIVMDVNLPDIDGYQLCNYLKRGALTALTPIIMLTAEQDPRGKMRALAMGVNDYIPKNAVSTESLIATLRKYIDFH